ncbi:hypothetical protein CDD83_9601 [Cordyceps sp. RAO-2017]|nr:hypothetical protein CDD83_9601 [Cordyceps sp. RAO-2017]
MELRNVQMVLRNLLSPNSAVLEFACGTGFYTTHLLDWGAKSLTAMDNSPTMLGSASARLLNHGLSGCARLVQGDGTTPQSLAPDGKLECFDLAFGAWFLNYARSKAELTAMFKTISLNLKPGGVFVGIVPHPTDDLKLRAAAYRNPRFRNTFPRNEYTEELESGDGWGLQVSLDDDGVRFMTWHMKQRVYEEAARLGGMKGRLEWRREQLFKEEWGERFGLSREELQAREENPHHGILVAYKD